MPLRGPSSGCLYHHWSSQRRPGGAAGRVFCCGNIMCDIRKESNESVSWNVNFQGLSQRWKGSFDWRFPFSCSLTTSPSSKTWRCPCWWRPTCEAGFWFPKEAAVCGALQQDPEVLPLGPHDTLQHQRRVFSWHKQWAVATSAVTGSSN